MILSGWFSSSTFYARYLTLTFYLALTKCIYCQAQSNQLNSCKMMTNEIARKAVDFALQSPQKELNFEFQGGEPLSNFPIC